MRKSCKKQCIRAKYTSIGKYTVHTELMAFFRQTKTFFCESIFGFSTGNEKSGQRLQALSAETLSFLLRVAIHHCIVELASAQGMV